MKQILVTGNAGSGKTTFAKKLSTDLGIPLHGLDLIVWQPGWKVTPEAERKQKIQQLTLNESWVVDGVSKQIFLAADTIFFLDIPLYRCLINIVTRFIQNGFKTRESLPKDCPEYIGVFKAIKVAFLYQKHTRPALLQMINEHPLKQVFWFKKFEQLNSWK